MPGVKIWSIRDGKLPIRKVSPSRVALTSYYGKLFVERSERGTFNYDRWLTNRIVALGTDNESTVISDLRLTASFDHLIKVPRVYSALAKRFRSFKAGEYEFYTDYHSREKFFGAEAVKEVEGEGLVAIARRGNDLVVVDENNTFYLSTKGKLEVLGKITDVIGPELGQPPLEMAEIKLFSKSLPIGLALGYLLGLDRLVAQLKLSPRKVPTGERLSLEDHEYAIRFADEAWVFSRDDQLATLIFSGFTRFKDVRNYSTREYNNKDVYINILENNGLQLRYMRELDLLERLFVDPITKELLIELKEPTNFIGLLFRATELLLTDWHPLENDLSYQRIKGYERFAGAVYGELVRGMRAYALRPKSRNAAVDINPQAVWQTILQDPAQITVKETSPLHNLREKEAVTFTGVGGRTPRSMVARTRIYNERDMGVISESTPDTGDVAVHTYLTPDAKFTSLRGITAPFDPKEDGPGRLLSSSALLAPASDRDDPRRVNVSPYVR